MDYQTIINIVLGCVTVVALIVTIRFVRRKRPVWAYRTTHVVGRDAQAPSELKLIFGDREVQDVYRTDIVFFNKGNEVIEFADVVANVNFHFGKAEVLKQRILTDSRVTIGFSIQTIVKDDDNVIELTFKWLGHNDGAVIQVFHTPIEDDTITCSGDIKNVSIRQLKEYVTIRPNNLYGNIVVSLAASVFMLWLAFDIVVEGGILVDPVTVVLILIVLALFETAIAIGIRNMLRYIMFPRWSRIKQ